MSKSIAQIAAIGAALCMFAIPAVVIVVPALFGVGFSSGSCGNGSDNGSSNVPANDDLFQAIKDASAGDYRLALSMLQGAALESGWNNTAEGGGAYGPFQIQDPGVVHPDITIAEAENPARAASYMLPRYKQVLRTVDPALWSTDPERAAAATAFAAERPSTNYYNSQGSGKVRGAYQQSVQVMERLGLSTDFGTSSAMVADATQGSPSLDTASNKDCSAALLFASVNATGSRATVVAAAQSAIGTPYSFGGGDSNGPTLGSGGVGYDCSGLVLWAFAKIGLTLPRTSQQQWAATKGYEVALPNAQPGDLIFWSGADGTSSAPGHVGIYLGDGRALMAPRSGAAVRIEDITANNWKNTFVGITNPYALANAQHA